MSMWRAPSSVNFATGSLLIVDGRGRQIEMDSILARLLLRPACVQ